MKYIYVVLGLISLGLGAAGTVLPLLPTTPLVLLAAFCFGKSSERLNNWFKTTRLYKNTIEGYISRREMTVKTKLTLLGTVTAVMGSSIVIMRITGAPLWPQIMLGVVWALHVVYFGFVVKTAA